MITINLFSPRTRESAGSPKSAAPSSGGGWRRILLINLLILVIVAALIMYLPVDTPGVGPYLQPARIVLTRLFDIALGFVR
ncbi:MAG: hypothetical protein FJY97_06870 [candidate division Zixibacteria bacterium]|nr:hypothetical protein [candidate division Zixibacteria bacterium]